MSDITELLDRKGLEYSVKGNDALLLCISPDHIDSTPSLRIDLATGQFNCFSCGFRGHSILEHFNEYHNPVTRKAAELRRKIADITMDIKGITLPDGIELFQEDFRGIPARLFKKYMAFQHPDYDDRLCFPIKSIDNKITNVIGRNLFTKIPPKYRVYPAGRPVPIFPNVVGSVVILVEGIFDVLNLEAKGITNAAALFGTQSLTEKNVMEKVLPLLLGGVNTIVLLLDNDKAGNTAAIHIKRAIENKTSIKVIVMNSYLPEGKDPGELTEEEVNLLSKEINKLLY